jgi:hypothetical protein
VTRQPPADHLPPEVFARPDFAVACANRDLGSVLRLAKRWGGAGFSASHLARRCGLTVSRVQDYVSGRIQAQQVGVFERVADGLHIPGVMFDLGPRPWEEATAAQENMIAPPGARGGHRLISTEFLWTPEPADHRYLEAVHTSIDELISLDNRSGGAEISSLSENAFQAVHEKLGTGDYERSLRKDLLAAAGELAEVSGWIAYDADRQDVVRRMNQEALYFTRLSGDKSIELLTLQNASMHAGFMNRPREALDIAEMVLENDYKLSPRLRALFLTRKAHALAQGGDESATDMFGEVRSLFLDGTQDGDPPWAWWIDERALAWHEAMCRKNLGDTRRAMAQFERSVDATPLSETRSQYLHRAYLLDAQVGARSWRAVESTIEELTPLAESVSSTRTDLVVRNALANLRRPESCAPRNLWERGEILGHALARSPV